MELTTTVLNGLPVTVTFSVAPADRSVGIMGDYLEEWYISAVNGRKCKNPQWIYKRMTESEDDRIHDECWKVVEESANDVDTDDDY